MHKNVEFSWILTKDELNEWIDCKMLKSFPSANFPASDCGKYENWVISVIPNGWDDDTTGMICLYVDLVRFPHLIKYLAVNWVIKMEFDTKCVKIKGQNRFGFGVYWMTQLMDPEEINNEMLRDVDSMKIIMEITITKIVGFNVKKIEEKKWNEFGVI